MSVTKIKDFNIEEIENERIFILDTNILYYVHSGYISIAASNYADYSNVIQKIIDHKNKIVVSALNLQEFLNIIEKQEYKLYLSNNKLNESKFTKKQFRKDAKLRMNLKKKIDAIMKELRSIYEIEDGEISEKLITEFVDNYNVYLYDPVDFIMVQNTLASKRKITYITNDTDFQCDSRIDVITK